LGEIFELKTKRKRDTSVLISWLGFKKNKRGWAGYPAAGHVYISPTAKYRLTYVVNNIWSLELDKSLQ
jgi:hypothetical protein